MTAGRGAAADVGSPYPRWVSWVFIALIALTPASPHVPVAGSVLDGTDVLPIAGALFGVGAVIRWRGWRRLPLRRAPEVWALAAIVPFTFIAALQIGSLDTFAAGPVRWLLTALLVLLAYTFVRTRADAILMLGAIVVVAAAQALIGIALEFAPLPESSPFAVPPDLWFQAGGRWLRTGRITGTTAMAATFLAGLFALALPMATGLALTARGRRRWWWIGAAAAILAGVLATFSRMPIALGIGGALIVLLFTARPRVWVPVLAVLAVLFAATPLGARMLNAGNDRLALWNAGWRIFADHWTFGVGPNQYMNYLPFYKDTPWGLATSTPHNSLLYVAAESGLFAALALAIAIAATFRFLRSTRPLVLGPMVGLGAFMIDAMTTNLYSIPSIAIAAWMVAPAVAVILRDAPRPSTPATGEASDGSRSDDEADPAAIGTGAP